MASKFFRQFKLHPKVRAITVVHNVGGQGNMSNDNGNDIVNDAPETRISLFVPVKMNSN